jgi:histidinol-phosphate aminotransferase
MVSNEQIIQYVQRVVGPFNVNSVTQQTIASALQKWSYFKQQIEYVVKEREWLMTKLKQIDGVTTYPSDANFILFKVTKPRLTSSAVVERMENRNVLVKDRGHLPLLQNCVRVTVGTRDMNESFLSALNDSLEE